MSPDLNGLSYKMSMVLIVTGSGPRSLETGPATAELLLTLLSLVCRNSPSFFEDCCSKKCPLIYRDQGLPLNTSMCPHVTVPKSVPAFAPGPHFHKKWSLICRDCPSYCRVIINFIAPGSNLAPQELSLSTSMDPDVTVRGP